MPKASRTYCIKTPLKKMGFSQRASCKAQGLIKRSSGKKMKSPKYKFSINNTLYASGKKAPRTKTGYRDANKAKMKINYQIQVVNTLYNRAKYHKYQTKDMRETMKIFKSFLKNIKSI
jgi:hypothetical protein